MCDGTRPGAVFCRRLRFLKEERCPCPKTHNSGSTPPSSCTLRHALRCRNNRDRQNRDARFLPLLFLLYSHVLPRLPVPAMLHHREGSLPQLMAHLENILHSAHARTHAQMQLIWAIQRYHRCSWSPCERQHYGHGRERVLHGEFCKIRTAIHSEEQQRRCACLGFQREPVGHTSYVCTVLHLTRPRPEQTGSICISPLQHEMACRSTYSSYPRVSNWKLRPRQCFFPFTFVEILDRNPRKAE